jgi:hypothetical protein
MPHNSHPGRRPPKADMSTAQALGVAGALVVSLVAAATGVLAAAGVLVPARGSTIPVDTGPSAPAAIATRPAPPTGTASSAAGQRAPDPIVTARPPAVPGRLTAFGATVADWGANHRADPAVGATGAYNPDQALVGDGRLADRYVRVLPLSGRILQYTLQLPRSTPFARASAAALAELPPDLRPVWQQQRASCLQAAYTSRTLAIDLAEVGDPRGAVLVEYRSGVTAGGAWDGADVTNATLSALDAPTAANGPLC